eukprot:623174-Prymnesium_polylepis.1
MSDGARLRGGPRRRRSYPSDGARAAVLGARPEERRDQGAVRQAAAALHQRGRRRRPSEAREEAPRAAVLPG